MHKKPEPMLAIKNILIGQILTVLIKLKPLKHKMSPEEKEAFKCLKKCLKILLNKKRKHQKKIRITEEVALSILLLAS